MHPCKQCDESFDTERGLKAHVTRTHKTMNADEAFALVGKATEVLFPLGVPYDRIIEVAELQKAMLKVVTR